MRPQTPSGRLDACLAPVSFRLAIFWQALYIRQMCYSAMVQQNLKDLGLRYHARLDIESFESFFQRRLNGEPLKSALGLEYHLLYPLSTIIGRNARPIRPLLIHSRSLPQTLTPKFKLSVMIEPQLFLNPRTSPYGYIPKVPRVANRKIRSSDS